MATREEIYGEIDTTLEIIVAAARLNPHKNMMPVIPEFRKALVDKLHSQGVVIKVKRELPKYWYDRGKNNYTEQRYIPSGLGEAIKEAGYIAVESLIEIKEPTPEPEQPTKCPKCEGKGFTEQEHGLLQIECEECGGTGELAKDATEHSQTQRSPNLGEYFCSKCSRIHRETSRLGKRHQKYNDNTGHSRTRHSIIIA